jgi:hypothetical protein
MSYCSQCGIAVPDGQRICSMCYGDIDHGRDGYYRKWAERQRQDELQQEQEAEQVPTGEDRRQG